MLQAIQRKLWLTQAVLLGLFGGGVAFLYLVSTVLFDAEQLRWEVICFSVEAVIFGVPLVIVHPLFRPILHQVQRLQVGLPISPQEATAYTRRVLSYPFKVSLLVFCGSIVAYILGVAQLRYLARLPWEGVVVILICGVTSGLLWGVLEYFLLEYFLQPLTGLAAAASEGSPPPRVQVSLKAKIFASSVALVLASLGFFGVVAYTRAAHSLEQEIGIRVSGRIREFANLVGSLPTPVDGGISAGWWLIAAEFPISPRGYFHIIDPAGHVIATHPASAEGPRQLTDEVLRPAVRTRVLTEAEGYLTDRVDHSKIVSFVTIPGTRFKVVAIAPLRDFSPQLDQLVYSGLAGMGFALLLSLGIGFLCARSITTSLGEVTHVAQALAEHHDLTQRVPFLTNDEVGVLAHAFNEMAHGLQTYAGGLEQAVAERTKELERRREQLEAKNHDLSDFLYVASHDLRAPLINLSGFSHALQGSMEVLDGLMHKAATGSNGLSDRVNAAQWVAVKDEIGESLDFILRATAKMDLLVSALLELSRIETRPHVTQAVDTQLLAEDILRTFHFQITEKRISVVTGWLPTVHADAARINQVFSNLIDNAIKYSRPGIDAHIEIGCEERDDVHCFYVRDSGRGIRPEDQDKVFRLFTRVGSSDVPGEGVGLAAVRKIIDKHGGKIWVESVLGHGSTFWFTLPRRLDVGLSLVA